MLAQLIIMVAWLFFDTIVDGLDCIPALNNFTEIAEEIERMRN